MQQNIFFEFANQYAAKHDSLTESARSDRLYREFLNFVNEEDFEYQMPSERYLSKIDSSLSDAATPSDTHIQALQQTIEEHKKRAFERERSEIEEILFLELITRYEGQQGQTSASLPFDRMVNEAIEVLHNSNRYTNILTVSN